VVNEKDQKLYISFASKHSISIVESYSAVKMKLGRKHFSDGYHPMQYFYEQIGKELKRVLADLKEK